MATSYRAGVVGPVDHRVEKVALAVAAVEAAAARLAADADRAVGLALGERVLAAGRQVPRRDVRHPAVEGRAVVAHLHRRVRKIRQLAVGRRDAEVAAEIRVAHGHHPGHVVGAGERGPHVALGVAHRRHRDIAGDRDPLVGPQRDHDVGAGGGAGVADHALPLVADVGRVDPPEHGRARHPAGHRHAARVVAIPAHHDVAVDPSRRDVLVEPELPEQLATLGEDPAAPPPPPRARGRRGDRQDVNDKLKLMISPASANGWTAGGPGLMRNAGRRRHHQPCPRHGKARGTLAGTHVF